MYTHLAASVESHAGRVGKNGIRSTTSFYASPEPHTAPLARAFAPSPLAVLTTADVPFDGVDERVQSLIRFFNLAVVNLRDG